ncbi:MAG: acyl-CoA dehydrogenase family protein, partial [Anaerolineae bacterium]|nr:acyl-CoA dehydrogenase family protein [Anaerolineae bacterium]
MGRGFGTGGLQLTLSLIGPDEVVKVIDQGSDDSVNAVNLRRFIDQEINPYVDEWEAAEIFPAHELFRKMGKLGFLGLTKPVEYGGSGLDWSYAMVMAETLGQIKCGAIPMAIGLQTDMATPALARFG